METRAVKLLILLAFVTWACGSVDQPKPQPTGQPSTKPATSVATTSASSATAAGGSEKKPDAFQKFAPWIEEAVKRWGERAKAEIAINLTPTTVDETFSKDKVGWSKDLKIIFDSLSSFKIQRDRVLYNVKNLDDWHQPEKVTDVKDKPTKEKDAKDPPKNGKDVKDQPKKGAEQGLKGQINEKNVGKFLQHLDKTSPFPKTLDPNEIFTKQTEEEKKRRLEELNSIVGETLGEDAKCQYDAEKKSVIVQGHSILLSKILAHESKCLPKGAVNSLVLMASHTLFLDASLVASHYNPLGSLNVFAYAPNWHNLNDEKVSFNLDGAKGPRHKEETAAMGKDGEAGESGRNGGNFVGVGISFIGKTPVVSAHGGQGGDGQNGGNGADGADGEALEQHEITILKFKKSSLKLKMETKVEGLYNCKKDLESHDWAVHKWYCFGSPPEAGKDGANGGEPGRGGRSGSILLYKDHNRKVRKEGNFGKKGNPGKGGKGGKGGKQGKTRAFSIDGRTKSLQSKPDKERGWALQPIGLYDAKGPDSVAPDGMPGNDGKPVAPERPNTSQLQEKFHAKYLPLFGVFSRKKIADFPTLYHPQIHKLLKKLAKEKTGTKTLSKSRSKVPSLADLVISMNHNDDIHSLRPPMSYFHDLKVMELQWPAICKAGPANIEFSLLPSYNALLEQILDKGKRLRDSKGKENEEYLYGLRYLYAAAYSRALQQPSGMDSILVTDMETYVDQVLKNFQSLKNSVADRKKLEIIKDTKTKYKEDIEAKLEETNNIIKTVVEPEIEAAQKELNRVTDVLLQEIKKLRAQGSLSHGKLEKAQKKLERTKNLRAFFSAVKFATEISKMCGKGGKIAASVIYTASGYAEYKLLGQPISVDPLEIPGGIEADEKEFITYYQNKRNEFTSLAKEQLEFAVSFLDQVPKFGKGADPKLKEISDAMHAVKTSLLKPTSTSTSTPPSPDTESLTSLSEMEEKERKKREAAIKELEKQLEKLKKAEASTSEKLDSLTKVASKINSFGMDAIASLSIPADAFKAYKNDKKAAIEMGNKIELSNLNLEILDNKIHTVEAHLGAGLDAMRQDIQATVKGLKPQNPAILDVSKWQIQKKLKEMQKLLSESFTAETKADKLVEKSFNTISQVMEVLIKVYDRMNEYNGQAKLATFIADINSAGFGKPETTTELGKAVQDIELIIQANAIRSQYELSLKSFKMVQFPFAVHFQKDMAVPEVLRKDVDEISRKDDEVFYKSTTSVAVSTSSSTESEVDLILSDVVKRLDDLHSKIKISKSSIVPGDQFTYVDVPFNQDQKDSPGPFFTWKNADFQDKMKQLLELKPITFVADIRTEEKVGNVALENGVKFNRAELQFVPKSKEPKDTAAVDKLKEQLKGYVVKLTHSGQNYYRYEDKVYSTMVKEIPMAFNYAEQKDGQVGSPNGSYKKILESPPCLSPFTTWTVQLEKIKKGGSGDKLEEAAGSFDLQLVGKGSRVNGKHENEDLRLDQFYSRVEL